MNFLREAFDGFATILWFLAIVLVAAVLAVLVTIVVLLLAPVVGIALFIQTVAEATAKRSLRVRPIR